MSFLEETSNETLAAIAKAQTAGITAATGVTSYDLTGVVSLVPVVTPLREKIARVKSPNGNTFATWRAITNLTNAQPSPVPGLDKASHLVQVNEQDFQASTRLSVSLV
jgi:hypothetical protein